MNNLVDNRPTFDFYNSPVRAAGVLFYRFNKEAVHPLDKIELLVQLNHSGEHGYEDLGGKTDACDRTFHDTAAREAAEETNYIINKRCVLRQLQDAHVIYSRQSKYLIFITEANAYERKLTKDDFSTHEHAQNYDVHRTIDWITLNKLLQSKYHPRVERVIDNIVLSLLNSLI